MKLPRDLSGKKLIELLCRDWDYQQVHRVGSHVIIETESPFHHRISVPDHSSLRIGTLNGILRAVSLHKGVTREELLRSLS
jgi:predicted RNA binding protein YcfA (HicA-like mRNA interferase family)